MEMTYDEALLAWGRYLSWADMNRERLLQHELTNSDALRYAAFASHWFASLWVAIEGFRQLKLRDNFVSSLLSKPPRYSDLLRECRNGVYHFEPKFIEPAFQTFVTRARSTLPWAEALRAELIRVFWQWPETVSMAPHDVSAWRDGVYQLLGWLPQDTPYMNIILIEREVAGTEALRGGPAWTPHLQLSLETLNESLLEARSNLLKQQQRYRDASWLSPDGPANSR